MEPAKTDRQVFIETHQQNYTDEGLVPLEPLCIKFNNKNPDGIFLILEPSKNTAYLSPALMLELVSFDHQLTWKITDKEIIFTCKAPTAIFDKQGNREDI